MRLGTLWSSSAPVESTTRGSSGMKGRRIAWLPTAASYGRHARAFSRLDAVQRLTYSVDSTDMQAHTVVQARPKPVDVGDGTEMHGRHVKVGCTGALPLQASSNDS